MMMTTPTAAQPLKLIFRGNLEFGSERTFNMVLNHWNTRVETYFKMDVLLKAEEVFHADRFSLEVPQLVVMSTEKYWRNTTALLQEIAQYAMAGRIGAWWVNGGQVLSEFTIEPLTDKTAVSEYIRGRNLVQQGGMENEATTALNNAIAKFERHAHAYERRGYINYKLKNFNDALYDFSKSIDINPNNPEPFYGRGKVRMLKNEWDLAALDFATTIKLSLAVQPMHWLARLRRGESLYHAKRFTEAVQEIKFFLQKKFNESDPNARFRSKATFLLAECEKMIKG